MHVVTCAIHLPKGSQTDWDRRSLPKYSAEEALESSGREVASGAWLAWLAWGVGRWFGGVVFVLVWGAFMSTWFGGFSVWPRFHVNFWEASGAVLGGCSPLIWKLDVGALPGLRHDLRVVPTRRAHLWQHATSHATSPDELAGSTQPQSHGRRRALRSGSNWPPSSATLQRTWAGDLCSLIAPRPCLWVPLMSVVLHQVKSVCGAHK